MTGPSSSPIAGPSNFATSTPCIAASEKNDYLPSFEIDNLDSSNLSSSKQLFFYVCSCYNSVIVCICCIEKLRNVLNREISSNAN